MGCESVAVCQHCGSPPSERQVLTSSSFSSNTLNKCPGISWWKPYKPQQNGVRQHNLVYIHNKECYPSQYITLVAANIVHSTDLHESIHLFFDSISNLPLNHQAVGRRRGRQEGGVVNVEVVTQHSRYLTLRQVAVVSLCHLPLSTIQLTHSSLVCCLPQILFTQL